MGNKGIECEGAEKNQKQYKRTHQSTRNPGDQRKSLGTVKSHEQKHHIHKQQANKDGGDKSRLLLKHQGTRNNAFADQHAQENGCSP